MRITNTMHYQFIHATGISLDKNSITLATPGQTEQLTATVTPADSTDIVTWSSNDTSIATVDQTGLVTCVTPGSATITATVNGYSASCSVIAIPDYYDISTYGNSTSITRNINGAAGFTFTANGTHLITLDADSSHRVLYDYALSTPYDTSTATLSTSKTVSQLQYTSGYDMYISPDETNLYILEHQGSTTMIYQYTISSGTLNTFTYVRTKNLGQNYLGGFSFSNDGTYLYIGYASSSSYAFINRYSLGTAWNINTFTTSGSTSYQHNLGQVSNIKISKDGGALYFTCASGNTGYIFQCLMGTAWDISSTTEIKQTPRIWTNPLGAFDFSGDLTALYTFPYNCTQGNYWKLTHS